MTKIDPRLGWIPDKHDHRDMLYGDTIIPQNLPARVDLTEIYKVPIVDQGRLGSCTGNAIASALSYLQLKEGKPFDYPSRLFIYYNERVIEGTVAVDAGAELRDGIKSIADLGFCAETDWPYDITQFAVKPSDRAYADAAKDLLTLYQRVPIRATSICEAIANGFPVIFGIMVYPSFLAAKATGDVPMPGVNELIAGGHAMIAVGYDLTTSRFKFQNSWGTKWGSQGFGTIPFDYLGSPTYGGDYWVVQADQIPAPTPLPVDRKGCLF
jgi:C1A family cysteine protease